MLSVFLVLMQDKTHIVQMYLACAFTSCAVRQLKPSEEGHTLPGA